MKENQDEVLRAIEERVNSIGWGMFIKPYAISNEKWHFEVLPNEEDEDNKRCFTVTFGSSDLSINFSDRESHKKFRDLGKMLDYIEEYLRTNQIRANSGKFA